MRPPLRMRAWIERQDAGTDPYGAGGVWSDVLAEEPCSWWASTGQEQLNPQRVVSVGGEHLRLAWGADIRAGDRVRLLVDQAGRTVWDAAEAAGLARVVEHVAVRRGHVEATLRSTS